MKIYKTMIKYAPVLLDVYIRLPFIMIRSSTMCERVESHSYEILMLQVHIFKWQFNIRLYKTFEMIESEE